MRKDDLKSRVSFAKHDQLCCAMMTKHIFEVGIVFFLSCFYMVLIDYEGYSGIVYEILSI